MATAASLNPIVPQAAKSTAGFGATKRTQIHASAGKVWRYTEVTFNWFTLVEFYEL